MSGVYLMNEIKKIPQMQDIWDFGACFCPNPEKLEGNLCGICHGKINESIPVEKVQKKRARASQGHEKASGNGKIGVVVE
jgi:hypothetical protein